MHILYMIDSLVPGGAERSLAAIAPAYARRGVQLDVAYLRDRIGLQDELIRAGARLFCLDGPGGRAGWLRRARKLVLQRQPDLIHTTLADSNVVGRIAGRLARIPVVTSLVNVQYGPEHASDPNVLAWRMRLLQAVNAASSPKVVRFHAVTEEIADVMSRRLRISPQRIDVIPRGRDPEVLGIRTDQRRVAARRILGIGPETVLVLAVARHEYQKRLDLLIEALPETVRQLDDVRLLIAGREGSATTMLKSAAAGLGLEDRVVLLGARDDVPELLCAADVLVLPSRREGLPGVLVEALALETPIVASDLQGVREVAGDDIARLVDSDRADELAAAIVATIRSERDTRNRTAQGRLRFQSRFTIDAVADEMVGFYRRALADGGKSIPLAVKSL